LAPSRITLRPPVRQLTVVALDVVAAAIARQDGRSPLQGLAVVDPQSTAQPAPLGPPTATQCAKP
jgi:hypothetical protein